jgi:flagellar hook-associated protein 2
MSSVSSTSNLALSGLASGLNWTAIVNDMVTAEQKPETQMESQQTTLANQKSAYSTINTDLTTLSTDIGTLMAPGFFDSRTATSSIPTVASATASSGTPVGSYNFNFSQLATAAVQQGTTVAAKPLNQSGDASSVFLASAPLATPVSSGTFSVNGQQVTVANTDTLQNVFDKISTATNGAVTASYDSTSDAITLSSSSPIVLGSAADTSNFLQATKLYNNGTGTVSSASSLGAINLTSALANANTATTISDGGNGAGQFTINGVAINYNSSTDSINDVLQRIDDSAAGVTATFNGVNDQFQLTNKSTGDVGISLQDVTGNFLAATGLSGGTLQRGNNLLYTINGGATLTSQNNTIDASSAGLSGLSVTALSNSSTTISVQSDTSTISSAINQFVTDYNAAQNFIHSQTNTTTNVQGGTVPGLLTGDLNVESIATQLRQLVTASPGAASSGVENLNSIGITSNGQDNTLSVNSAALTAALGNNLDGIKQLFTKATTGLGKTVGSFLTDTTGSNGVISSQENNFTQQITRLTTSIKTLQTKINSDETNLQNEFVAMENAMANINSQKQYLAAYFGSGTSSNGLSLGSAGSNSGATSASTG